MRAVFHRDSHAVITPIGSVRLRSTGFFIEPGRLALHIDLHDLAQISEPSVRACRTGPDEE